MTSAPNHEKQLGLRIREIRKQKNLTQQGLAEKASFSTQHIGDIERGEANPTLSCLATLATVLEVSIAEFFKPVQENGANDVALRKDIIKFVKKAKSDDLHTFHAFFKGIVGK